MLKKAFTKELPESIKGRRKQGFGIPVGTWFRGPLHDWAKELLVSKDSTLNEWFDQKEMTSILEEHRVGRLDHGKRIYALAMLALWKKG